MSPYGVKKGLGFFDFPNIRWLLVNPRGSNGITGVSIYQFPFYSLIENPSQVCMDVVDGLLRQAVFKLAAIEVLNVLRCNGGKPQVPYFWPDM